jgi:hypothetical protein
MDWDCNAMAYVQKSILPSGNTIKIEFQEEETRRTIFYNIYLVTAHKRTQEIAATLKQTGRDGLAGLLWAKDMLLNFENFILDKQPDRNVIVYCFWDDNRRRKVYGRGLTKIGYKYGRLFNKKVLYKQVV